MEVPERRDVWVAEAAPGVPAHRTTVSFPDDEPHPVFRIVCPPGVAAGGVVITRARAAELQAYPCCLCFGIDPATAHT